MGLVIGSDLVYNEVGSLLLPRVLRGLLGSGGPAPICLAQCAPRSLTGTLGMRRAVRALTLWCGRVAPSCNWFGPLDPGDSESGFLEELFPEKRIAVFQIRFAVSPSAPWLPWSDAISGEARE